MQSADMANYFGTLWSPRTDHIHTGPNLVERVGPEETVLDVGCGFNPYKAALGERLVGIDPYNDSADIKVSIEDYVTEQRFDVAFCLGSINFGPEETIIRQIKKVVSLLKPHGRIYWRQNPGIRDHQNAEFQKLDLYPWTVQKNFELAELTGCIVKITADDNRRIFSEWVKQ